MTKKTKAQRPVGMARVETKAVAEVTVPGLLPVPLLLGGDGIKRFSPAAIALRLGASRDTANQRAKRNYSEGACMMRAPSASGPQWVLAIDLKHISAFLLGFAPATVGEEIAPRLEEIRGELHDALVAHTFEDTAHGQLVEREDAAPQAEPAPEVLTFSFQGDELVVVKLGADVYVGVQASCDAIGIAYKGQIDKLTQDPSWGVRMIITPSPGGLQQTWCIPLRMFHLWLATIHPSKVKPEVRTKLIRYKREAGEVLPITSSANAARLHWPPPPLPRSRATACGLPSRRSRPSWRPTGCSTATKATAT